MIADLDHEAMVAEIAPLLGQWLDAVVPARVELFADHRYSPRYAWMFAYEKRLKYRIEETLGRRLGGVWEGRLFGADGTLSEGLSNAFVHGNRGDRTRTIEVRCAVGTRGLVFSIRDQGEGFDVAAKLGALRRAGRYYQVAGNGLRALADSEHVRAAFADRGARLNLLCFL